LQKDKYKFKMILIEIMEIIWIDFKDNLLDKRSDYYVTRPADLEYDEG